MSKLCVKFNSADTIKIKVRNILQLNSLRDADRLLFSDYFEDINPGFGYGYCLQVFKVNGTHILDIYDDREYIDDVRNPGCTFNWWKKNEYDDLPYDFVSDENEFILSEPADYSSEGRYAGSFNTDEPVKLCVRLYVYRAAGYTDSEVLSPMYGAFAGRYDFIYKGDRNGSSTRPGMEFKALPPFKCVHSQSMIFEVNTSSDLPAEQHSFEMNLPDLLNVKEYAAKMNFYTDGMLKQPYGGVLHGNVYSDDGDFSAVLYYPMYGFWRESHAYMPNLESEWNTVIKTALDGRTVSGVMDTGSAIAVNRVVYTSTYTTYDLRYNTDMKFMDFNGSCGYISGFPSWDSHSSSGLTFCMFGFIIGIPVKLESNVLYSGLKLHKSVDYVNTGLRADMRVFVSDVNCSGVALGGGYPNTTVKNGTIKDAAEAQLFFGDNDSFAFKNAQEISVNVKSVMRKTFTADDFHVDSNVFYFDRPFYGKSETYGEVKMIFIACRPVGVTHDCDVLNLPFMVFPRENEYYLI